MGPHVVSSLFQEVTYRCVVDVVGDDERGHVCAPRSLCGGGVFFHIIIYILASLFIFIRVI